MPYLTDREAKSFVSNHHICTKLSSEPGFKWHHPQLADTVTCLGCIQISDHCSQGKATHSCRALQQPTCTSGTAISGSVRKTCWCCAWVYAILYSTTISCNPATCNVTLYRHPHQHIDLVKAAKDNGMLLQGVFIIIIIVLLQLHGSAILQNAPSLFKLSHIKIESCYLYMCGSIRKHFLQFQSGTSEH